ncbi:MAG: hypothetical protein IKW92_09295 [Firmicutes bacterium]|nr:hypothetical protein [Bacillota bacterium]
MERREIIDRIIAVAIAIGLWFYVISVVNPPTTVTIRQVPVTLLNQEYLDESRLAIAGDGNYTVDVSLSGKRKDLILTQADLTATADLNGLLPGQNYITVKVTSPGNTTVEEIRTEKIQVYIDELIVANKPVELNILNVPAGTELSAIKLDHETISVSGAKSLVDMVDRILVTVDAAGMAVDEPEKLQLAITPVDAEGNVVKAINTDPSYVTLSATLYTVKSVPLYTRVDGTPGMGLELMSSNIPSTVSIKGTLLDLAKINYIDAEPLDIEGITANTELEVVPILPEGVELASSNGSMIATFTLSEQGQVTLETDSSAVTAENVPDGMEAALADETVPLTITVKGSIADITDITAEDIILFADLSEIIEPGEYEIPISGRAADGKDIEVTAEPASVLVTVTATETETQEEEETPEETPEG